MNLIGKAISSNYKSFQLLLDKFPILAFGLVEWKTKIFNFFFFFFFRVTKYEKLVTSTPLLVSLFLKWIALIVIFSNSLIYATLLEGIVFPMRFR